MAEVAVEAPVEESEQVEAKPVAEPKPLGENGEKALKAERDARRTAERALAERDARLKELEDRDKSEEEKRTERLAKAERERDDIRSELIRERIARRHKIDDDDLDLLGSGTEEEIEARAKKIAAKNAAAAGVAATVPPSEKPVEKLRPGATSTDKDITAPDAYPSSWRTAKTQQTRKD